MYPLYLGMMAFLPFDIFFQEMVTLKIKAQISIINNISHYATNMIHFEVNL